MSFLNLRIRGRLYGGFGALVLSCAALAGFAVWQLWGIDTQVAFMTLQSKNAIRAGEIATELQATRRALLRYAFDQDEASFAESEKHLSKITHLLEEAARTTPSEERRAMYTNAIKEMAEMTTKRAALGEAINRCWQAVTCCSRTATRWRPTSRNLSTPRIKRTSPTK